jgi:hypothetical protein
MIPFFLLFHNKHRICSNLKNGDARKMIQRLCNCSHLIASDNAIFVRKHLTIAHIFCLFSTKLHRGPGSSSIASCTLITKALSVPSLCDSNSEHLSRTKRGTYEAGHMKRNFFAHKLSILFQVAPSGRCLSSNPVLLGRTRSQGCFAGYMAFRGGLCAQACCFMARTGLRLTKSSIHGLGHSPLTLFIPMFWTIGGGILAT